MISVYRVRRFVTGWLLCLCLLGAACASPRPAARILIFAPHPDDETFCCGTVIQQALAERGHVHVVIVTNGDGFPQAAARLSGKPVDGLGPQDYLELARVRQSEALSATAVLGLRADDITFLGYPDAGLDKVYEAQGDTPYLQPFTQKGTTYGPVVPDYHSQAHGQPAPYRRQAALADVTEVIQGLHPDRIYVPSGVDTHLDHQATGWFVRDALQAANYRAQVQTYVIHASGYPCPEGLPCPAPFWSLPTNAQAARKYQALLSYSSQVWQFFGSRESLETYASTAETFWPME